VRKPNVPLEAWFLGSMAENAPLAESLILEAFRDHVFWRRNFHPEDGPIIREADKRSSDYQDAVDRLRQEFYRLLARLKSGAPTFSHRHVGHMVSDITMAGLIGYFAAMLYNPNNINSESSPVGTELEAEVGLQLQAMLGFGDEPEAWCHLTSGGTLANLEALWGARSLLYLPIAVALTANELGLPDVPVTLPDGRIDVLQNLKTWQLLNLTPSAALDLAQRVRSLSGRVGLDLGAAIRYRSIGHLGTQGFAARTKMTFGEAIVEPVVIVPVTKHYSWTKLVNVLGLGSDHLVEVPIDAHYRMDLLALQEILATLREQHVPVLALVGVCGSTEVGAMDDLEGIVSLRRHSAQRGQNVYMHVDAAYGGYAPTLLWDDAGRLRSRRDIEQQIGSIAWPTDGWYASLQAIGQADSVTVDPHKLGYIPYPAGAIAHRDGRVKDLLAFDAPYVFTDDEPAMGLATGRSVIEGSRPGAAAAACWLSHRAIPLNATGYGAIIGQAIASTQRLRAAMLAYNHRQRQRMILPIHAPDLNVLCFLVATEEITDLAGLNALNREVQRRFSTVSDHLVFSYEFLISQTSLSLAWYRHAVQEQVTVVAPGLRFDEAFCDGESTVMVMRLALMNPFFGKGTPEVDFIEALVAAIDQAIGDATERSIRITRPLPTVLSVVPTEEAAIADPQAGIGA
jgi:glutamate/tyrosine decarboxylase-like PLP-dependent enzyme